MVWYLTSHVAHRIILTTEFIRQHTQKMCQIHSRKLKSCDTVHVLYPVRRNIMQYTWTLTYLKWYSKNLMTHDFIYTLAISTQSIGHSAQVFEREIEFEFRILFMWARANVHKEKYNKYATSKSLHNKLMDLTQKNNTQSPVYNQFDYLCITMAFSMFKSVLSISRELSNGIINMPHQQ